MTMLVDLLCVINIISNGLDLDLEIYFLCRNMGFFYIANTSRHINYCGYPRDVRNPFTNLKNFKNTIDVEKRNLPLGNDRKMFVYQLLQPKSLLQKYKEVLHVYILFLLC